MGLEGCFKNVWELSELYLESYSRVNLLIGAVVGTFVLIKFYEIFVDGDFSWKNTKATLFRALIKLPIIRGIAAKELSNVDKSIAKKCRAFFGDVQYMVKLPRKGIKRDEIIKKIEKYTDMSKIDWKGGRVSGGIYSNISDEQNDIITDIFRLTAYSNPLHPDVFPQINKMEAEIVRMTCNLFNGDLNSCGAVTSGGTESILLAMKAYRDYAKEHRGITKPELVVPVTGHAAFEKACQYFCIKFITVPVDPVTAKCDLKQMNQRITRNTIALVGSACNFPHGIIDDIVSIGKLGLKYNIPVHVDSCLGGFLVPFVKEAGFPIDPVDFTVPGVTSISADTHKYGYAPKGTSVIMYSDKKYRKHQFSVQLEWPGGIYASPTISGSRCGANIATCWASLIYFGHDGYVEATKKILSTQRLLVEEVKKIDGLYIIGDPLLSVVSISSEVFNIYNLCDMLGAKGWNLNQTQHPAAFHICLTLKHVQKGVIQDFIRDLKESTKICLQNPSQKSDGIGAIYGLAQTIPDKALVNDVACVYLNSIYETS